MKRSQGEAIGTRILLALYRLSGYGSVRFILHGVVLYYFLTTLSKRHRLAWLYRAANQPLTYRHYYRHLYAFAASTLDRFVARHNPEEIDFTYENLDAFMALERQPAILLMAHFGGWGSMAHAFQAQGFKIHVVIQEQMEQSLQAVENKEESNRGFVHFIEASQGPVHLAMSIARALMAKEMVAIMTDRPAPESQLMVAFMGGRLALNPHPFEIAFRQKTALLATFVLAVGAGAYRVRFVPIEMDFSRPKTEAIAAAAQHYANHLEKLAKAYPHQWFNFDTELERA